MRVVIDQLTRMAAGYICVGGLDDSGRHIRPVLDGSRIPSSRLERSGGPFSIGALVDLGPVTPVGSTPEVEDHLFEHANARRVGEVEDAEFWERLVADAEFCLVDIFGHDLAKTGRSGVVAVGAGMASLGTLMPGYRPQLKVENDKLRCLLVDPDLGELNLSVTDVRFYDEQADGWKLNLGRIERTSASIADGIQVILSVGLGRPWPKDHPKHWLQVNNVHLQPLAEAATRSYSVAEIRKTYPNAYAAWAADDERLLTIMFRQGLDVRQMAKRLGRKPGGISSRLRKLGLIG